MPCAQERSLFLRRPAPGLLARGGTSSARLPKTIQFFLIKLRSSGRTGIRCRAARRQVARRSPSLDRVVFFSPGPGGADGEPQRGGVPGGHRHHPVSAHLQRHQPGAGPRHHADVCGESEQASQQRRKGGNILSWVQELLGPRFQKGIFFL